MPAPSVSRAIPSAARPVLRALALPRARGGIRPLTPLLAPLLAPLLVLLVALLACQSAAIEGAEPFSEARFRALQAENALILIDVAADWCPTCRTQAGLIERYLADHPDRPLHVLRVDFDRQKAWVKAFGAPRQSTLLLFRGEEQLWFSVAETREDVVFAALDAAAGSR